MAPRSSFRALYYLHRAEECDRQAKEASSDEQRKTLLERANGWRVLSASIGPTRDATRNDAA
jgi:hypothetical protein